MIEWLGVCTCEIVNMRQGEEVVMDSLGVWREAEGEEERGLLCGWVAE
jgi:hypothetical protein